MSNQVNNILDQTKDELRSVLLKVRIAIATGHTELLPELNQIINNLNKQQYEKD